MVRDEHLLEGLELLDTLARAQRHRFSFDERRLFGYTMSGRAPTEGSPIVVGGDVVGHVSGSWASPLLGHAVMLGWQKRAPFADRVEIDGREAIVAPTPFYDPEGRRARA